jgi:uncharacterized protein
MKKMKQYRILLIVALLALTNLQALNAQSIAGDWYGLAEIQGMFLQIDIHITETDEGVTGTFDVPDQGAQQIPFTSMTYDAPEFKFSFTPAGLSYEGFVDPGCTRIVGKFKQGDLEETLNFTREPVELPESSMPKIKEKYDKKEVYITMRDGVRLFTSIYTPKDIDENTPILITRTPYNSEGGGEEAYNQFLSIYYRFIKENYIFVFQDVRGRFMSEGEFEHVRPINPKKKGKEIDEASDTYDTVEWLLENVENNNGKVGVSGISYPGFYATLAAIAYHPAIKAVSPQAPVTNWWIGDDWHHNGAVFMLDGFSFYNRFSEDHPEPTRRNSPQVFSWGVQDSYEYFMRNSTLKGLIEKDFSSPTSYFTILKNNPDYNDYWKSTDPRPHLKNISAAVMTVGGWFDAEDCWGAQKTYEAIENQNPGAENIVVIGPWSHGQWALNGGENMGNMYWGMNANDRFHEQEVAFFNYYLKGEGENDLPEALIFMTGANEWREFDTWPPENVKVETMYFSDDEQLSVEKPQEKKVFDEYVSDPNKPVPYTEDVHLLRSANYMTDDQRFASRRPDVLVYETEVLEEDYTLTGTMIADLYVSTTGTDADFIVKVIDVYPDNAQPLPDQDIDMPLGGYQMLVRGEVFRGRYRNSLEKPEAFVPGEITQVKYELPGIAHTFKKGHRMMVQVQSSWFPLVDRNPQTFVDIYNCNESDFQKASHRIYRNKKYPSGLQVMVLE